jgi:hypothetical protein
LNTPASTLVHGLHALAAAIHPDCFAAPAGLRRINATSFQDSGTEAEGKLVNEKI